MQINKVDAYQEKYPISTTKEYITGLIHDRGVDFHPIIGEGHELTLKEANLKKLYYQDKNWMANTMNGNIIGLLRDYYPDSMQLDKHKRAFFELAKDVRIYFKKMDDFYKPQNIKTKHVEDLWSHSCGEIDKIHTLYMGYVLENSDWTAIKGIYASYPNNFYRKKIDWVIDMNDFTKSLKLPSIQEDTTEQIIITPKTNNDKTGEI